ncbi:hypothetical protein BS17DRAFT_809362 [Gyrodon lividus]|nr:hypothetical protein BS17DRAFT_883474 [Gyrodon lividus]KAF9222761.1 hypothetical protein BS17DRAFT_809362 [Gyrodon lividus]
MAYTKNVVINSDNLGANATVVFVFDAGGRVYTDYYPVVLRVSTFGAQGCYATSFRYTNQLSFVKPQGSGFEDMDKDGHNDEVTIAATWVEVDPGQQTTLTLNDLTCRFSEPTSRTSPNMEVTNKTGWKQDIAIGFRRKKGTLPQSAWLFPDIGDGYNVTTNFTPLVRAYVAIGYQENQVLRTPFSQSAIWEQDLGALPPNTDWMLNYDRASGKFSMALVVD